ncbi:Aste57867_25447 [Aphanomyces stellatus]|uniref:Aste57867_25447 protein n=1 Tax=Aphanomyces stellatus TaxID=120398 RepID=A0A485LT26_9STRA|nr:hypothetical protein As57867_025368 [Aphanomyces stellatus]VFU02070.1 Aste57867_25447 [Aphanomyces stellatus]
MAASSLVCRYFHMRRGCKRGNSCQYDHAGVPKDVLCEYFGTSVGCNRGSRCKFYHEDTKGDVESTNQRDNDAAVGEYGEMNNLGDFDDALQDHDILLASFGVKPWDSDADDIVDFVDDQQEDDDIKQENVDDRETQSKKRVVRRAEDAVVGPSTRSSKRRKKKYSDVLEMYEEDMDDDVVLPA